MSDRFFAFIGLFVTVLVLSGLFASASYAGSGQAGCGVGIIKLAGDTSTIFEFSVVPSAGSDTAQPAWVDYDNDGWLDLYVSRALNPSLPGSLFHHLPDGTFEKILDSVIATEMFPSAGSGAAAAETADDGKLVDLSSMIEKSECYAKNEASGYPMSNLFIGDSRLGCKSDADEQLNVPEHADLGVAPVARHRVAHGTQNVVRRHHDEDEEKGEPDGARLVRLDHRRRSQNFRRSKY